MPNVALPKFLNADSLYLYCELSAVNDDGLKVDFTGLKTYSIGFLKENLGFGITDINVSISPSLQPEIRITFKDFYGNLAFGFSENKQIIEEAAGRTDINDMDFSSMFDLPYPKFTLTLKGYLGSPIVLELNVKRIDVSLQPSDGSYEIKALFVPNLYGFFIDMPYYFLKAVKSLRLAGANINDRPGLEKTYLSTWDIATLGEEIQQEIQTIEDSFGNIENNIKTILNGTDGLMDIDFFGEPAIVGKTKSGVRITGFDDIFINIDPLVNGKNNLKTPGTKRGYIILNNGFSNGLPNREIIRQAIIASVAKTATKKKLNLLSLPQDADYQKGKQILDDNLKKLEAFRNTQVTLNKESRIKQVTIKNVFDLLIKDSAFLMGKILEAGQIGYNKDPDRKNSTTKFGNYFPLIQDPANSDQQVPDPNAYEVIFVRNFVRALTEGIVSDINKGIANDQTSQTLNTPSVIKKRVANIEILSNNPYDTSNVDSFIESLLLRSGIAVSMYSDVSYSSNKKQFLSLGTNLDDLTKNELENLDDGLKKISAGSSKFPLLSFCKFIKKIINTNGDLLDAKGGVVNLSLPIETILENKYKLPDDTTELKLKDILNRYFTTNSGFNKGSYKQYYLSHNNLPFFTQVKLQEKNIYVLFKDNDSNSASLSSEAQQAESGNFLTSMMSSIMGSKKDTHQAYDSDSFIIKQIKKTDDDIEGNSNIKNLISEGRILDFDKLKSTTLNTQILLTGQPDIFYNGENQDIGFTKLQQKLVTNNYYVGLYSTGHNQEVWNLFGVGNTWINQRKFLRNLCSAIESKIGENEDVNKKQISDTIAQLESQYNVFYTQFHHICNNWKNLLTGSLRTSKNIAEDLEKVYTTNGRGRVIYEMPLQQVQDPKGTVINVENSIINTRPLNDNNSETTVLNIMSNICNLNNFMFLSIPGNGLRDHNIQQIFTPYDRPIKEGDIPINNFFYVLFMPTPENRVNYNNRDKLYQSFNPQLKTEIFEIDFGSTDNTIVKNINLTTEDSKVTAESAIAISNLVDGPNSRKAKNLDCSALSIMEGRSYRIKGEMIGNAQIVPTQFFMITKIPIFNGLYQIMKVEHRISNNNMTTSFEAIKMKFAGNNTPEFVFVPPFTLQEIGINEVPGSKSISSPNTPSSTQPSDNADENFSVNEIKNSIKPSQETFLKELHPDVRDNFRNFINTIQEETDFAVIITSGYRTFAEQEVLKKQNVKNATPGLSHHNYGMALDINLQSSKKTLRKDSPTQEWEDSGALAIADKFNLRWGGKFKGYEDRVHFDMGNTYNTLDLLKKAKLQFGNDYAFVEGNKVSLG